MEEEDIRSLQSEYPPWPGMLHCRLIEPFLEMPVCPPRPVNPD